MKCGARLTVLRREKFVWLVEPDFQTKKIKKQDVRTHMHAEDFVGNFTTSIADEIALEEIRILLTLL